ncbi:MAG: TonB-dependent receptor, partial [Pseudomonadota bacterium]
MRFTKTSKKFTASAVALTTGLAPIAAAAADVITVTATRRAATVQDVPLNISAVGGDQIDRQGFTELGDVLPFVPGINVIDIGGRQGNDIIVRGLSVDPLNGNDGDNDGGGTVATYLGEIPVFIDLKLNDMERVEVLLGPQGTLYGAGTLGGAIRYIPRRPQFGEDTLQVRGELSKNVEAEDISSEVGFTFNKGISDTFALRGSFDYESDSGFIDYVNVVRQPGVSDPNPDFSDPDDVAANLRTVRDVNFENTISARIGARWQPSDAVDANLTYYYQNVEIGGRQNTHFRGLVPGIGQYENANLVLEPNEIINDLVALEVVADFGFAELTSASGYSTWSEDGQRDQTALLIGLDYSYELFPSFTAFTSEVGEENRFNQEIRLVSKHGGPFNWIIGGFYNRFREVDTSSEFTPGYDTFNINEPSLNFVIDRPDDLEYFSQNNTKLVEMAVFGELGVEVINGLTVTGGFRYFDYELESFAQTDFPLFGDGPAPLSLDVVRNQPFDPELAQSDNGFLFKANASYEVNDDVLVYFTVSEGYRIGETNGEDQCPAFDPMATQGSCALAPGQQFGPNPEDISVRDERQFFPDQTRNYEIGLKSALFDNSLIFNAALFHITWSDPQVSSSTVNASIPITVNGDGARSRGVEVSTDWTPTDRLRFMGTFSHVRSQLTAPVPDLVRTNVLPGFNNSFEDGEDGDRLPGSPETQASIFSSYSHPLPNQDTLNFDFSYAWQSDVLTRAGGRGESYTLP